MKTIQEAAADHVLTAAHRGSAAGNIPCNTLAAYEIALRQGADIVEIDVAKTADGALFVFHPGMEFPHLRLDRHLADMTADEVEKLRFVNVDGTPTVHPISRLDEVLDLLKGRCYVNIDKFWTAIPEITAAVRRHNMQQEVIVKTSADPKWFDLIEEQAPELPYMAIIRREDTLTESLLQRKFNYIGAEVLFTDESDPVASPEYIRYMHDKGLLLWGNAIIYNYKDVLAAGHSDDISLTDDPEKGWGWLARRGFDIIQTDWTLPAVLFLKEIGR